MKPDITIYGIRNCDTMKKAFSWLDGHGVAYRFHDYKKDGVPADRLRRWIAEAGWEKLVNTRGTTYRKLPPARQQGLDDAKALALLQEHPSAIKRPVLEAGKTLLIGFDATAYSRLASD
jgi:arsenate reductase